MRNNRQHKKISKQAMDLLISHFGYLRKDFSLENELCGRFRDEWHFWTAPCYWYGEQDSYASVGQLSTEVLNHFTSWTEDVPVYSGPPMPSGDVALIRFVKAKIKAKGMA
ncbi:hypothetical protein A9J41_12635 [Laribacter hongkongensis]|uniref:hypothetical protein n=2 Tax=Laribacter hongkongensis TaxID=168471 RepID=UPI001877DB9B|nr:hypothetical protein [Laribacter hongkongensis]MBE5528354.1 hypothetical protein [Laribacter hongkongensis]